MQISIQFDKKPKKAAYFNQYAPESQGCLWFSIYNSAWGPSGL